jgi:hypothetical protein
MSNNSVDAWERELMIKFEVYMGDYIQEEYVRYMEMQKSTHDPRKKFQPYYKTVVRWFVEGIEAFLSTQSYR